ncbi:beta galactosidase jelly roll domain-containing protein, partial [bacterium]|nr:beta galactosidase jelly roll domain-containing protein [bacterium]
MKKSLFLLVALIAISACAYTPVKTHIMTTWGENMTPDSAWQNYPRPNLVRSDWQNLNGLWKFAVTKINEEMPKDENWQQDILVPFAPESALSGVGRLTEPNETLWYKRTFNVPEVKEGLRYFLNFEAVDWRCQVFVNGKEATAAPHVGGNVPFAVEVTDLVQAGENTLIVTAWDPSNSYGQPTGKQSLSPQGCFYTRVSGIYGSVWMETTPKGYITGYNVESDIDKGEVKVTVECAGDLAGAKVTAEVSFGGEKVAEGEVADWSKGQTFTIPEPKLWDIGDGNLYDLKLTLETAFGKDEVMGYFGMRKIEFKKDELGIQRIYLNNKKIFMQGTLDQGWWPDGLLTPPSDEAMQYDIDILKEHGYNFMRKHIKIEPRRYYYLCDKAGFPIWQDMVSGGQKPEEKYHIYRAELVEMIKDLRNFPSIVVWIAYNEGWGQPDKEKSTETTRWLKQIDTTRLVSETSGWTDHNCGDMKDHHQYPSPLPTPANDDRLTICGEFG